MDDSPIAVGIRGAPAVTGFNLFGARRSFVAEILGNFGVTALRDTPVKHVDVGAAIVADHIVFAQTRHRAQTRREHVLVQRQIHPVPVSDLHPGWQLVESDQRNNLKVGPYYVELRECLRCGGWKWWDWWFHWDWLGDG